MGMVRYQGKLLELPRKCKAIVVTDLHGNLKDYRNYLSIYEKSNSKTHFIITGDFIHGTGECFDGSLEILDSVKENFRSDKNFHVLLGNHELSHITGNPVYRGLENQKSSFEDLLRPKYPDKWENKLQEYIEFFMELPVAVKTDNKVIISHSAPSMEINNLDELKNITNKGYSGNCRLSELLWARAEDFREKDLNSFLKAVGCSFSIVGHTCVDGFKTVFDKQLIVSSSYSLGRKAYVELNLEDEIKKMDGLVKMIKYV